MADSPQRVEQTRTQSEEQLNLLQTITHGGGRGQRSLARLGSRAPPRLREDGLGARTGLGAEPGGNSS